MCTGIVLLTGGGGRVQVIFIFLLNPANADSHQDAFRVPALLARVCLLLQGVALKTLLSWIKELPADTLGARCVRPLERHLTEHLHVRPCPAFLHSDLHREQTCLQAYGTCKCGTHGHTVHSSHEA